MASTKRTPREAWEALEEQAREDEISRFLAKPASEVDARLRASGHDPAAVREEGAALGKQLLADRARLAWQAEAAAGLAREQARFDARASKHASGVDRAELRSGSASGVDRTELRSGSASGVDRTELRSGSPSLTRAELRARIEVARRNPRLVQPVAVMFRNRSEEEASEDELRAILDEIEALADRED